MCFTWEREHHHFIFLQSNTRQVILEKEMPSYTLTIPPQKVSFLKSHLDIGSKYIILQLETKFVHVPQAYKAISTKPDNLSRHHHISFKMYGLSCKPHCKSCLELHLSGFPNEM